MTTFRKRGAIINMSSSAGELPTPQMTVYAATKVKKKSCTFIIFVFFFIVVSFFYSGDPDICFNCSCFFVVLPSFLYVCLLCTRKETFDKATEVSC